MLLPVSEKKNKKKMLLEGSNQTKASELDLLEPGVSGPEGYGLCASVWLRHCVDLRAKIKTELRLN